MPIDPRIPLGTQVPNIKPIGDVYEEAMQLRDLLKVGKLRDLQISEGERNAKDAEALERAVRETMEEEQGGSQTQETEGLRKRLDPNGRDPDTGYYVDPKSGKIEKDMDEARFAIDCVMALSDKLAPRLDEIALREVRGLISNLQINFVNQSAKEA